MRFQTSDFLSSVQQKEMFSRMFMLLFSIQWKWRLSSGNDQCFYITGTLLYFLLLFLIFNRYFIFHFRFKVLVIFHFLRLFLLIVFIIFILALHLN